MKAEDSIRKTESVTSDIKRVISHGEKWLKVLERLNRQKGEGLLVEYISVFQDKGSPGDRWWWWLHNMNALIITRIVT